MHTVTTWYLRQKGRSFMRPQLRYSHGTILDRAVFCFWHDLPLVGSRIQDAVSELQSVPTWWPRQTIHQTLGTWVHFEKTPSGQKTKHTADASVHCASENIHRSKTIENRTSLNNCGKHNCTEKHNRKELNFCWTNLVVQTGRHPTNPLAMCTCTTKIHKEMHRHLALSQKTGSTARVSLVTEWLKKHLVTYCFAIHALCSKASSGVPILDLKKSICFRNWAIASSGALCWNERRQIYKWTTKYFSNLFFVDLFVKVMWTKIKVSQLTL